MKHALASRRSLSSAAIVPTLWVMVGCFGLAAFVSLQAQPGWWGPQGAVNSSLTRNDYAVATQGQLKKFTVAAVNQLNTALSSSGGAGPALTNLVYGWHQDYLTNGYATNTANPTRTYKPADLQAVDVGQLKFIASLVYGQLASAGYTGLYPSWIVQNTATDNTAANLGQLKQVFNFDLSVTPGSVSNLALSANNPNEVDLSWTLPAVNNASFIQVAISSDGGATWTTKTLAATATSYAATGLIAGQGYLFRVTTGNSGGGGMSAPTSSSSPVTASAAAPASVSVTLGASNSVNLSWSQANASGVSGFNILQSTNSGASWAQVGSAGAGAGSVTLTRLPGAMDTSQFEVVAVAGSATTTSSPITPTAGATNDTDGDGTNDNVDGWAGFTDPTQEKKLAPPRIPNPSYVAVTISTIPNTYTIDFVNHAGQAVVHAVQTNSDGSQTTVYYFWDKGATVPTPLPTPVNFTDPFWSNSPIDSYLQQALSSVTYPVSLRQPTGLSDAGTVIGFDNMQTDGTPYEFPFSPSSNLVQGWRWTKGMAQVQLLADLDSIDQVTSIIESGWSGFSTKPIFIKSVNGVETIYAYHQDMGVYNDAYLPMQAYTEVYSVPATSTNSTPPLVPTLYYAIDQTDYISPILYPYDGYSNINNSNYTKTGSHESRLPSQDNGNQTIVGTGAEMDTYQSSSVTYQSNSVASPSFDADAQIFSTPVGSDPNNDYYKSFYGLPLEPQPAPNNTNAPPGGGYIVYGSDPPTADHHNRFWINGTPLTVSSNGYVLGMQNSTTPANPTVNTGTGGPYLSSTDPANVPFPTIWAPQTNSAGAVTGYTSIALTMPQPGLSFKGNAGLFFNKNLQIAGGQNPLTPLNPAHPAGPFYDTPFLWQNYQYHNLSDFFPGLGNYSQFQVKGLDDNGTITAIATPSTPANASQQIVQLIAPNIRFATPGDSNWSDLAEKQVMLFSDSTLVHITIPMAFTSLAQMTAHPELSKIHLSTNVTLPAGVDVPLTAANCVFTPGTDPNSGLANTDLKITLTRQQIQNLGLLPAQDQDNIDEKTWYDWGSQDSTSTHNLNDSLAFDAASPAVSLGQCSSYGHLSDQPPLKPNSPLDKSYLEAAGREVITVSIGGLSSAPRAIAHQADTFYISAEGHIATGLIETDGNNSDSQNFGASDAQWNHSLKTVIVGGCSVLAIRGYSVTSLSPYDFGKYWATLIYAGQTTPPSPGTTWEGTGPQYLLGYDYSAPTDTQGSVGVITSFESHIASGMNPIAAWGAANNLQVGDHACAIDVSVSPHKYWYFQRTFSGVTTQVYTWTSVSKTGAGWP